MHAVFFVCYHLLIFFVFVSLKVNFGLGLLTESRI